MKLAKQIADDIYKEGLMTSEELCAVESIVAAKLGLVRDALLMMWDEQTMSAVDMIEKYEAAIAMLSEEENHA